MNTQPPPPEHEAKTALAGTLAIILFLDSVFPDSKQAIAGMAESILDGMLAENESNNEEPTE